MITLNLSERDVGRLLVGVRERRRKLERGTEKFKTNWDAEKGQNMADALDAYTTLERRIRDAQDDHSRRAGRDPQEHEVRD